MMTTTRPLHSPWPTNTHAGKTDHTRLSPGDISFIFRMSTRALRHSYVEREVNVSHYANEREHRMMPFLLHLLVFIFSNNVYKGWVWLHDEHKNKRSVMSFWLNTMTQYLRLYSVILLIFVPNLTFFQKLTWLVFNIVYSAVSTTVSNFAWLLWFQPHAFLFLFDMLNR